MKNRFLSRNDKDSTRHVLLALGWYSHQYHRGVAAYAKSAGWSLDATTVHAKIQFTDREYEGLAKYFDGIICCLPGDPAIREFVSQSRLPVVDLAIQDQEIDLPRVLMDNPAIGRLAARTFLERGFRNLAFCQINNTWSDKERFAGFSEVVEKAGKKSVLLDWSTSCRKKDFWSRELLCGWLCREFEKLPKPLAVMAANDDAAVVVLDACQQAGLLVPEQVAIVGCDNDELVCDFARVPLSSVDPCMEEQARKGAELLDFLMRGEPAPKKPIRLPPREVVIRQSSDILAVENVAVATALRFIWKNYTNPNLSVPLVADAAGLSLRGLSKSFRQHIGRGVGEEIRRMRMEKARALLEQGDALAYEIADECGFASSKHLRETLKREVGRTPRRYRDETVE